jgi:hypothetical protein
MLCYAVLYEGICVLCYLSVLKCASALLFEMLLTVFDVNRVNNRVFTVLLTMLILVMLFQRYLPSSITLLATVTQCY